MLKRNRTTDSSIQDRGTIFLSAFYDTQGLALIGNFKWTTYLSNRTSCYLNTLESGQYCKQINCQLKDDSPTILWSCSAAGMFVATDQSKKDNSVFHFWNAIFGNGCIVFHAHHERSRYNKASEVGDYGEIRVNIVESFYADLSKPDNPLITNSEDVAKLKIEGHEIYVPKKELTSNSHFFDTFFNGDFREKAQDSYELREVKLNDFLQFLGQLHGVRVSINEKSVHCLLKLADMWQCKLIIDRCEEYLKTAPVKRLQLLKKLELALKFKLYSTLTDVISEMSVQELKKVCVRYDFPAIAHELMLMKLCLNNS
ncbi:hypothetical protein L596_013155 [Steinernema carpocapsae]|uniref:BTB domain-containing protein n=1 Tax=Steinernema carpocapsae TaxID=34508 RepID=A0A4U5NZT6_STECR|nr:hypothetical protein L596_013155 [Steinernema carpocapsae]